MSDILNYLENHSALFGAIGAIVGVLIAVGGLMVKFFRKGPPTADPVLVLDKAVMELLARLLIQKRELCPGDSMSIRNDGERELVEQMGAKYRALPEDKRRKVPGLLNNLGKAEFAAGNFEEAQQKFQAVATMHSDPKFQAEAHYNAYQAALQRQAWAEALASIQKASALDPARFAPFPLDKYEPTRILGAGGFGVAFLCHHKFMKENVVVKTLQSEELDCNVDRVFSEAQALKQLDHPSIIHLSDCGYADAIGKSRPYLAMDYFEGENLESFVAEKALLSTKDLLAVAIPVAEALQAAHARGIFHRDVKPGNILVRREGEGWRVKLIDFGLALRPGTLAGAESTHGSRTQTTMGKSIAGTLHYAAPEQMGELDGVPVGAYSDVYGFGRTCYYALFETWDPDDTERDSLPEAWRRFLGRCTGRTIANRLPDFTAVLAGLRELPVGQSSGPIPSRVRKTPDEKMQDWIKVCKTLLEMGAIDKYTAVPWRTLRHKGCIQHGYDPIAEKGYIKFIKEGGRWVCYVTAAGKNLAQPIKSFPATEIALSAEPNDVADDTEKEGYWFVNVGESECRNWDDCRKYGFLCAGWNSKCRDAMKKLQVGDKLFAYLKSFGYVGFGEITKEKAVAIMEFSVDNQGKLIDLPLSAENMKHSLDDLTACEWVVGVKWHKALSRDEARWFQGGFANQNIVCNLRDQRTLDYLKQEFGVEEAKLIKPR